MDIDYRFRLWLEKTRNDPELHEELQSILGLPSEIEDRFYRELEFGTGGLRGILGAGTNRMNVFTVSKASQGYSNYLTGIADHPSVAIAYDSRIHSDLFAKTAASVFAANGIEVFLYPRLMPTPALSFAVRDLRCSGGVVITASHNPAKYNGYKVYGPDGCQITTEAAKAIQAEIDGVEPFENVRQIPLQEGLSQGRIRYIGEDTVDRYLAAVRSASLLPPDIPRRVSIVYTPLNGAGISCVPRCLEMNGFTGVRLVEEQSTPDGRFPTCPYPNPEIREALEVGLSWAKKTGSDLLLATDPDCDRVGAAVKDGDGYTLIGGNEMGVLLFDFICRMRLLRGDMPEKPVAVKTIVTTPMAQKIADCYQVELRNVLTGFKFIGEQIGFLEGEGKESRFIFGFEESYGYLSGSFVRDKDAVNASLLICEMFAWYQAHGKTLIDALEELYARFGHYSAKLMSFTFEGSRGLSEMQEKMRFFREHPFQKISDLCVEGVTDYLSGENTGLPASDVIQLFLEGGAEVVVRPSGTEPKLKVYLTAAGKTNGECLSVIRSLEDSITHWIKR